MTNIPKTPNSKVSVRYRPRLALLAFLLTFIIARIFVFLIMAHRIPDLYIHLMGTHVHHLNFGIFLLAGVGAYLLFSSVSARGMTVATVLYGIGLALTFDEFGMWVHLGGSYWQRASFDAVIVLAALLALIAYAPPLKIWHRSQVVTAIIIVGFAAIFYIMLIESFKFVEFEQLEKHNPP